MNVHAHLINIEKNESIVLIIHSTGFINFSTVYYQHPLTNITGERINQLFQNNPVNRAGINRGFLTALSGKIVKPLFYNHFTRSRTWNKTGLLT